MFVQDDLSLRKLATDQVPATEHNAVSAQQASAILGVTEKTLANWRAAALGPPFLKYGSRNGPVRYILNELIAWRDTHRHGEG